MAFNELRAITTFVKAAELGSLRGAALAQAITPQAASQALGQLEAHLGVRLFHRTTRRLGLTEEGREFLAAARPGLASLQHALHSARRGRDEIAGPLRIVAPHFTLAPMLWPVLEEYIRLYPDVVPDVQLEDRIGNWVEDRVDVGLRAGAPPDDGVVGRRLVALQLVTCATPAYLARHGTPRTLADLAAHRCSGFRHPTTGRLMPWEFRDGEQTVAHDVPIAYFFNDIDLELRTVLAGVCLGQLLGVTVAPLVRSGALVPVLGAQLSDHLGLYLYYGSRVAQSRRVRAFIDLAVLRLAGNPALFLAPHELAPAPQRRRRASA